METNNIFISDIYEQFQYVYLAIAPNKKVIRPRKIYEDYHNIKLGKKVVYHLDGNKHNDNINNLIAISRKELYKRNTAKRWSKKI